MFFMRSCAVYFKGRLKCIFESGLIIASYGYADVPFGLLCFLLPVPAVTYPDELFFPVLL